MTLPVRDLFEADDDDQPIHVPAPKAAMPRAPVTSKEDRGWPDCAVCGKPAHFGFGVSLRKGEMGRWSCAAHRDQVRETK